MADTHPLTKYVEVRIPATATGSDLKAAVVVAPWAGVVTAVAYIPDAAVTGAATNYRTFSVKNKGTDGTGTTSVASLAFDSTGVTAAANAQKALTLTATTADLAFTAGQVLAFESIKTGTGIADPGGLARVTLTRS